jgi:hypothetical protein
MTVTRNAPFCCPECRQPAPWEGNPDRPFCSERCRLKDLGRWAAGEYRVPADEGLPEDDESRAADGGTRSEP